MVELISIVVPLYNKEGHIGKTLDSILDQIYKEFEVLVVDDGSTDASADVVRSYTDHRIQLIQTSNQGVSSARNKGIEAAKGQWVAFLDADDWWDKEFLSEMRGAIEQYPDEKVFASGRSRVFLQKTERYNHKLLPADGQLALLNYFQVIASHLPLINSSNACISKELILGNNGFKAGQRKHEDHDLWMRICVDQQVVFLNKNLSFYNKVQQNSAANLPYGFQDFNTYLDTMNQVYNNLAQTERAWVRKYAFNFLLHKWLKNKASYTAEQLAILFAKSKALLSVKGKWVLWCIYHLPVERLYFLLKKFR